MRSLHVVYSFRPDAVGGTEVYVEGLCRALLAAGDEAVVAAPGATETGDVDGLRVRRFGFQRAPKELALLYGRPDPVAVAAFERLLEEEQPDVVHQHAVSPACSVELMVRAKARRLPVVFTYHTPAASCQRGTLMRWGRDVCDGRLQTSPCVECTLSARIRQPIARALSWVPPSVGRALGRRGLSGGPWTALRTSSLVQERMRESMRLFRIADRYVALSPWVRTLLAANGVPAERIVDVRHGVDVEGGAAADPRVRNGHRALRIVHLGRLDPVKGTDILIRAVRAIVDADVSLDVFGVAQGGSGAAHGEGLRALAAGDDRIRFRPVIARDDLVAALGHYDLVAVPSQSLETGPLVVLEAFAAGVPVIGSALGGIADRVVDGVNGILVRSYASVSAWREAIEGCARDRERLDRLRRGIARPRTARDVAREMRAVYVGLVPRVASEAPAGQLA
jgi:glycosyltransferase involved in cell wall biosynthesis